VVDCIYQTGGTSAPVTGRATMKVCEKCGEEISTKDGEGLCPACEKADADGKRRAKASANRKARDAAMRSLGLVKVRGAMGGTYWE
jgi:hypothetical protein